MREGSWPRLWRGKYGKEEEARVSQNVENFGHVIEIEDK